MCLRTLVDAEAFINAVDVVVHLHDPPRSSTERTSPLCSAHVQLDDVLSFSSSTSFPPSPIPTRKGGSPTVAVLRLSPALVEHHHRHHAVVLTKLSLNTRLDRSSSDIIELNVC